jgi:hypothetical protein
MARPRTKDADLPPCVYLRHGGYYFVKGGRWTLLSKDKAVAIAMAQQIALHNIERPVHELIEALRRAFVSRKADAKKRGILFNLEVDALIEMAKTAKWRCAVTGLKLNTVKDKQHRRAPYGPSIDRIVPSLGYTHGNVRIVCMAANFAMNEWGDEVMKTLSEAWIKREFQQRMQ